MNGLSMIKQILKKQEGSFALLHRPDAFGKEQLEILFGEISTVDCLDDIPLANRSDQSMEGRHEALVLIPHQQITEQGYAAIEDGSPLIVLSVIEQGQISISEVLSLLPDESIDLSDKCFDIEDDDYANIIRAILKNEICNGEGSNFVISRSFIADIEEYSINSALSLFRRLLLLEAGTYWTFLIHTSDRTFVGATPERHISLKDGLATMNPISGTYRYPASGPVFSEIIDFLNDSKETEELYMVLDEELKMMARICHDGGQVIGPFLRQMSRLAHTEYYIKGNSDLDPREILKESMFAPTVTGSPLENACRVIARHEAQGRGYYGGIAALISHDANDNYIIDSAILIRTADIQNSTTNNCSQIRVGVGATLVRHSDPSLEVSETHAKTAGILGALMPSDNQAVETVCSEYAPLSTAEITQILEAIRKRNTTISDFWLSDVASRIKPHPQLRGQRVLIIDAEDTFIAMIAHQLRAIGLIVEVARFDETYCLDDHDLVIAGPGPGDPRETRHPRMAHMSSVIEYLLFRRIPFLAVCLSHQLLCGRLGLGLIRREVPNQGIQREINLFGFKKRVGFYNSYVAWSHTDLLDCPSVGEVKISRDIVTGEVHALEGSYFSSVQFHIESVLTQEGVGIFTRLLTQLLKTAEETVNS